MSLLGLVLLYLSSKVNFTAIIANELLSTSQVATGMNINPDQANYRLTSLNPFPRHVGLFPYAPIIRIPFPEGLMSLIDAEGLLVQS
jgi:hypothetical protein